MKKLIVVLTVLISMGALIQLSAGPTILRDNRITDIANTPALGRGYTMATNTYQSLCMKDIKITEPSYDFQYKFQSLTKDFMMELQTHTHADAEYTYALTQSIRASATADTRDKVQLHSHHIRVEINMDTYYASIDEANSRLSDTAANLLKNNDIPGFFSSCGSYYIRSLGRNARFLSIFSYKTKTVEKDASFEAALSVAVKTFVPVGGIPIPMSAKINVENSTKLAMSASEKQLTITTMAWGLGKNEGATLISYDLETFKAAIKDAFISMQNPMTGKVKTMEVVPWIENTEFQDLIKLDVEIMDPETGKKMLLYKKKHILNLNSEFLAEIERADRNMMNIYYKAKICRQMLDGNFKKGGKFLPGVEGAKLMNLRTGQADLTVKELDTALLPEAIDLLLKNEEDFLYKKGGQQCIQELLESGMFRKSWRSIAVCKKIRGEFAAILNEKIDDHCMPILAPGEPKKKSTTAK